MKCDPNDPCCDPCAAPPEGKMMKLADSECHDVTSVSRTTVVHQEGGRKRFGSSVTVEADGTVYNGTAGGRTQGEAECKANQALKADLETQ